MTTKMLGQLCVNKFQNLSNLCIEHVQKHETETVVSTLNTKVGMITGSNIVVALSFQVCYRNLMLKGSVSPSGDWSAPTNLKLLYKYNIKYAFMKKDILRI